MAEGEYSIEDLIALHAGLVSQVYIHRRGSDEVLYKGEKLLKAIDKLEDLIIEMVNDLTYAE